MQVRSYKHFDALPSSYMPLFEANTQKTFFLSLEWFVNFAQTALESNQELWLYGLEDDERGQRPLALLICRASRFGSDHRRVRTLSSLSNFYTLEFAPLLEAGAVDRKELLTKLMTGIRRDSPRWDVLELNALDRDAPIFDDLVLALRKAGWIVHLFFQFGNWYETVEGKTYKEYRKRLPSGIRQLENRFERSKDLSFVLVDKDQGWEQALLDYQRVYAASWKEPERYPRFIPGVVSRAAGGGALRLGILYAGSEPAAAQIWITSGEVATIYKIAYDQAYKRRGVGSILSMKMMRQAIEIDRVREINYGSGDDPYKRLWMSHRRERWGVVAFNRYTFRGSLEAMRQVSASKLKRAMLGLRYAKAR